MPVTAGAISVDVDDLEERLKAISFSNRLELLWMLRVPRTVDEIHLTTATPDDGAERERPLSREAVRHHLEKLAKAGLVRSELTQAAGGRTHKQYVLDDSALYALAETLRRLCKRDEGGSQPLAQTQENPQQPHTQSWVEPPRLVLTHGAPEQQSFPLRTGNNGTGRGWILGRDPDTHVRLPDDPYVSSENAEILEDGDGFEIVNLRSARNGVKVNGRLLGPGDTSRLEHGDILDMGSSTLVFHEHEQAGERS